MRYFIYILECSNGAYYTGYTTDMARRYQEHQKGTAKCKYTRSFPPVCVAACWEIECSLSEVLKIEHHIKAMTHKEKELFVRDPKRFLSFESILGHNN